MFGNLVLIVFVYIYALARGDAKNVPSNPKKIIVIHTAKLGDMVCATPVFRAIKKHIPGSQVVVVGNKLNNELLSGNKDIDEYIVFEKNFFKLINIIRKSNFDFGCVLNLDSYAFSLMFLGGVKAISLHRIENGFSPFETKTYKVLRQKGILVPHFMGKYAPREYLRLLEPIGIFTKETKKVLSFSRDADGKVKRFFAEKRIIAGSDLIVGVSPSSGNKIKNWSPKKFAEVSNHIDKKYKAKVLILGGTNDVKEVNEMISFLVPDSKVINTLGVFNIEELKALISKMDMFISVDTGPIYIAEAFNIPTIDIVGPMDEREQPPISRLNKIVKIKRQRPQLHVMNARVYDKTEAKKQIDKITVNMVTQEIDNLFDEIKK